MPAVSDRLRQLQQMLEKSPQDTFLLVLVAEIRFIEIDRSGKEVRSFAVPSLPTFALRLRDGSTLGSGLFGVKLFGPDGIER